VHAFYELFSVQSSSRIVKATRKDGDYDKSFVASSVVMFFNWTRKKKSFFHTNLQTFNTQRKRKIAIKL